MKCNNIIFPIGNKKSICKVYSLMEKDIHTFLGLFWKSEAQFVSFIDRICCILLIFHI